MIDFCKINKCYFCFMKEYRLIFYKIILSLILILFVLIMYNS